MKLIKDIIVFTEYVNGFYNLDYGFYPIGTAEQIDKAIYKMITEVRFLDINFDSVDRERVRGILEKMIHDTNVDNLSKTKLG
jgi:hypothetical protein